MGGQRADQITPSSSIVASQFSFVLPGPVAAATPRTIEVTVDPYDAIPEADEAVSQEVDVATLRAQPMEVTVVR